MASTMNGIGLTRGRIVPNMFASKVTVVLGAQWGDEGKGKVVDMLATDVDIVCRCQGGNNAGHTVVVEGIKHVFHMLPSSIFNQKCVSIIGNGVVINIDGLFEELAKNEAKGLLDWDKRLIVSDRSHIVFEFHKQVDGLHEAEMAKVGSSIGTTKMGIGPAYANKATRNGIRVADLMGDFDLFSEKLRHLIASYQRYFPNFDFDVDAELIKYRKYAERLRPLVKDTVYYLSEALKGNRSVLVEGANAAMLDIDFGTYPYVTSSNCSIGGVLTGLGLPTQAIGDIIGVVKAYSTRLANGPFPTEQINEIGKLLQTVGDEVGALTKQTRRCGWLDLPLLKYTHMVNGYTAICLTKLDILDSLPEIKVGINYKLSGELISHYPGSISDLANVEVDYVTVPGWQQCTANVREFSQLPANAQSYVRLIEQHLGVPVEWIGVGKGRESIIRVKH